MAITFPKPNLIKPKVPAVVALGLLVAQYLLLGTGKPTEPYCKLKIERPHHSTYLKERDNIDAVKLNISSECNVRQKFTQLIATIETINGKKRSDAFIFKSSRSFPTDKEQRIAVFKDLFVKCDPAASAKYAGSAVGEVYLKSGLIYPVKFEVEKFYDVECRISAK